MRKIVERRLGCSDDGDVKNAKRAAHRAQTFAPASGENQTDGSRGESTPQGLLRRSAPRNDSRLRCHCERSEAISVSHPPEATV
jgi:hypothetical protein